MALATKAAFDERGDVDHSEYGDDIVAFATALAPSIQPSLYEDLAEIERDWRAFEAHADCTAFQTFDWLATAHRHIGSRQGVKPAIVVVRHDRKILFILPLALESVAGLRRVTWLGAGLCNYGAPLLAPDFATHISPARFVQLWQEIKQLLQHRFGHDLIDLDKIPETVGIQANPLHALSVTPHANDSYLMHLSGGWDRFYAAKRSASRRKTDGKKRQRLAEHGEISFATVTDRADVERAIDDLIEQKRISYANLGVANMFDRPGYREFFIDVASNPHCYGVVHTSSVGSKIVATSLGLIFHGNYDYVLASYAGAEFARYSPGTIHLYELMRYSLEREFKTFDFNIGDEPYKREWFDVEVKLYDHVSPATLRGWMAATTLRSARVAKRFVKRNPRVWSLFRKARAMLGTLRRR